MSNKEYLRQYYLKNREKLIKRQKEYYHRNKILKTNPIRSNGYIKAFGEQNDFDIINGELVIYIGERQTVVDEEDAWILSCGRIHIRHNYAFVKGTPVHRIITGAEKHQIVDHKNQDTLDNRKQNLRLVGKTENALNQGLGKNNSTGFTGVSKARSGKFVAYICLGGKKINLGTHDTASKAHNARVKYEIDNNIYRHVKDKEEE